ncbi:MAG: RHS repeat-associated core domain-containing protein [Chloroflexota bacterium]
MSHFKLAWDGNIARTNNFMDAAPVWEDIKGSMDGNVNDVALNWQSAYILSNYADGALGAYVVTTDDDTLRVYYSADVRASSVSWTLQETFMMNDDTVLTSARIATSKTEADFAILAWRDRTGTYIARTTDGSTWGEAELIGFVYDTTEQPLFVVENDDRPIGLTVDGDNQFVTGSNNTSYGLFNAEAVDGDFGFFDNGLSLDFLSAQPFTTIEIDPDGIVGYLLASHDAFPVDVTFDSSSTPYDIPDSQSDGAGETSQQFTNDMAGGGGIWVDISLGDILEVSEVSFEYKITHNNATSSIYNNTASITFWDQVAETITGVTFSATDDGSWHSVNTSTPVEGVAALFIGLDVSHLASGLPFDVTLAIRNVEATPVSKPPTIYRFSKAILSQKWADITPIDYAPAYPFGLSLDRTNTNALALLADDGTGRKLLLSSDQGLTWVDKGTVDGYQGIKWYAGGLTLFGEGVLDYSGDLGQSFEDKTGNWASVFGSMGIVLGVVDPVEVGQSAITHTSSSVCESEHQTWMPVLMRTAEKIEKVTDFAVNTPAGPLSFIRFYRQNRLADPTFQFMGLGWTHNHVMTLAENTGVTPNTMAVKLDDGDIFLTKTDTDHYQGDPGSITVVDVDPLSDYDDMTNEARYTLTSGDKSVFLFDSDGYLRRRIWANGEYWDYTYTTVNSEQRLYQVIDAAYDLDGEGLKRSLTFSYYGSGDYQLYRVTDHTGRFVELSYAPDKIDDSGIVDGSHSVLVSVTDVRDDDLEWQYDYYGQHPLTETDVDQLNFLTKFISPSVDITGDDSADSAITIKNVTYTLADETITQITQALGIQGSDDPLMEVALDFQPDGENVTTETVAGQVTTHRFKGGVYEGTELPEADGKYSKQDLTERYRPYQQVDANGNPTSLEWSSDAKQLTKVTNALGHETSFSYNLSGDSVDTLSYSIDAQGRKTEYAYDDSNNPRQPTSVKVFDLDDTTVLRWQAFTYDSNGRTLTEKLLDPADPFGSPIQQVTREYYDAGAGFGLLWKVTQEDIGGSDDVVTTYTYDLLGRVIKTQQTSNFGSCEFSYTVYDAAGNMVATICNYDPGEDPDPTTAAEAVALYDSNEPDKNQVTTFVYDAVGRRVQTTANAGADFEQTTLTVYDALNRVVRTIGNYKAVIGISNPYSVARSAFDDYHGDDNTENRVSETAYNARGLVKSQTDVLGNVTLLGYDPAGRLVKTIRNASVPGYNNDYSGMSPDPTLEAYTPGSNADEDLMTTQAYDAAGNLVKTIDALGTVNFTVYDALNRPVKTVRAAKENAIIDLNPGDVGYAAINDPRSAVYVLSDSPDRDLVETTDYDALGRVIRTQRLLDSRPDAQWDSMLFGYDALGRQVKTVRSATQSEYDLGADPDLSEYVPSPDADSDLLTQTVYDANGRVLYTTDALGARTYFVYDGLGRQVRAIANFVEQAEAPELWVWDINELRWELSDGAPDGTPIDHGTKLDQNIVSLTQYNSDGRVLYTQDIVGRVNTNVYDARGRSIRTIANYAAQGGSDPADWVWSEGNSRWEDGDDNAIDFGTDNDFNVIADTVYDAQGRVLETIDQRHNVTHFVYDVFGRRVKTVSNYVDQGEDPELWVWDSGDARWEQSGGTPIDLGVDNDQNRISATVYDLAGRVFSSRDAAGVESRIIYDALGRQVKTIANYVEQGSSDPADWVWSEGNSRWEDGDDNAIDFGENNDQNRISTVTYNGGGQVVSTRDARGTQTAFSYDQAGRRLTVEQAADTLLSTVSYTCYDKAGRVLRTIANWSDDPLEAPPDAREEDGSWSFAPEEHGADNDADLITEVQLDRAGRRVRTIDPLGNESLTRYFKDGQVQSLTDAENMVTAYRYNGLRRRTRVVQGYQPVSHIAFYSDRDANLEIYTMNPDGSNPINRSNEATTDQDASWSPDGSQMVFISKRDGGVSAYQDVYVMDADGSNVQRLTDLSGLAVLPAWSPDGNKIAFSFRSSGGLYNELYVMDADGSNQTQIYTDPDLEISHPSWSPDSQRLAVYIGPDATHNDIYVMDADGTNLVNLTDDDSQNNTFPSWSKDGSKIAFQSHREGNWDVIVMDADGTNQTNLTSDSSADDFYPAWSPDGSQIVFYSTRDGDREIFVMDADGENVLQLTDNSDQDRYPQWQPFIDPAQWVWNDDPGQWEDGYGYVLVHGANSDQNIIVDVTYDLAGRVVSQRDPRGNETTYTYDRLNRRLTLTNPLDITWATAYANLGSGGSQVVMTYPGITSAADYAVERTFDRLGRLLSVAYGDPDSTPDVKMTYDAAGNRVTVSEYSDVDFTALSRETHFSYDAMRRMAAAEFDTDGDTVAEEGVSYAYDVAGQRTLLTLPGNLHITYAYDERGRLIALKDWDHQETAFEYDEVSRHVTTERANHLRSEYAYDAGGRLTQLRHLKTPGPDFPTTGVLDDFDRADGGIGGNWSGQPAGYAIDDNQMLVDDGNLITWNPTSFGADQEAFVTLTAINEAADEIDLLLKTDWDSRALEIFYHPGGSVVQVWTYNVSENWVQRGSDITVTFAVGDQFGARALADGTVEVYKNGTLLGSRDASGWADYAGGGYIGFWLVNAADTVLENFGGGDVVFDAPNPTLAHFEYQVNKLGNRTQALEVLAQPETTTDTIIAYDDKGLVLTGSWSAISTFQESTDTEAVLKLLFLADEATLTMGKGPDHSIYDLYLDGAFWQSVDGYAASPDQEDIPITNVTLLDEGPHTLEIRNQENKNGSSSDYKVRFNQLLVEDKTWTLHTIEYNYDALSRLLEARYNPGINVDAIDDDLLRRYQYAYDLAGNRLEETIALNGGMPTTASYSYNPANQIDNMDYEYDANGNLIDDGTNTYTWDRANHLVQWDNGVAADLTAYAYDGLGNRISQSLGTTSPTITKYLLDIQPGLSVVLSETTGANTIRNVHAPRGIHAHKDAGGAWEWMVQDGLGSVRGVVDNGIGVLESRNYDPYGTGFDAMGSNQTVYGFTGEPTDDNGLLYLRARYYNPVAGVFTALDPFEGIPDRSMSLNGYSWGEGNVPNVIDPSGMSCINASVTKHIPLRPVVMQINSIETLINTITQTYPVRSIERGLDSTGKQQLPGPFTEQTHLSVLEHLQYALKMIDEKLKTTMGRNLVNIFTQSEYLDIRLDFLGRNGDRSGITPHDIPNLQRLGNNMTSDHITHEWGHAIDRKVNFRHSNSLANQGVRTTSKISATATISITNIKKDEQQITGLPSCSPFPLGDPIEAPYGTSFQEYLLSGFPPGSQQYQRCLVGYGDIADSDIDPREDWADMFMNWVYDRRESDGNAGFSKVQPPSQKRIFGLNRRTWIDVYARGNL